MEEKIKNQPKRTVKDFISKSLLSLKEMVAHSIPILNKEKDISTDDAPTKEKTIPISKEDVYADLQEFKTVLGEDKNYMEAIDFLHTYDTKLSQHPEPAQVSATREMFSAILDKAGYEAAAVHLELDREIENLNRLFGIHDSKSILDIASKNISILGISEIEVRQHLIDMAEMEKAYIVYSTKNKEELHDVHLSEHDFQVVAEGKTESQFQKETKELSNQVQKANYVLDTTLANLDTFIEKEKRNTCILQELKSLNIDKDELKKTGAIDDLLAKSKTSGLVTVHVTVGEVDVDLKAKLSVNTDEQGNTHLLIHPKRELEVELSKGFQGHVFSKEEKGNLMALGSAGKVISVKDEAGASTNYLVGIDSLTNELVAIAQKDVVIKDEFGGVRLSPQKKEELLSGKPVFIEGLQKGNIECSSLVQYNVEKGRLEMLQYGLNISSIQNVKLQKEQQELLKEGKTVLISGLFDGKGVQYNAWVRLDMKNMKIMSSKEVPEKVIDAKKEIISSIDHRTQVAQNTKGVKAEENKFSSTPILSGTQKPSDGMVEKKNKGHKM